jgi:pSer/pThr/pTyr-binding forkhead associated (FHA) protein
VESAPPLQVRLVLEKGRKPVKVYRLRGTETIVGRAKGSGLRIPSAEVSRRHCLLSIQQGFPTAEDLGSANGTLLNGSPIRGKQIIRPGDQLTIGPVTFVVEYQLTQAAIDAMLQVKPAASPMPVNDGPIPADVLEDPADVPARAKDDDDFPLKFDNLQLDDLQTNDVDDVPPVTYDEEAPVEDDEIMDADVLDATSAYDESSSEHNPNPDQLRDLLAEMDDSPKKPPESKKKKSRKGL